MSEAETPGTPESGIAAFQPEIPALTLPRTLKAAAGQFPAGPGTFPSCLCRKSRIPRRIQSKGPGRDLRAQRRRVADCQCDEAFPFRLKRRHIHDDSAAGICRFTEADRQNISW